ncbi:SprB repeat-containing protein, partial [Aequorivita soesokkakensis]|uniref:SprB repeat-containing protein n=1 Tax=Aequorivita soesokkakensis TaxID=1385699 RepID=UPI000A7F35F3
MFKIITKLFASDKRFLIGLILIACLSSQGYSQVKSTSDGDNVVLPYTQEYLDQYNAALDKKAADYNATFRSKSKAEAFNNAYKGNIVGACNLITCGSFEKADVSGGTFRTAVGGTNGQYQADARYTCWDDDGTVDWSEGQYISYSQTNANTVYPGIIEPSTFDGGGFAIFSYQNEAIRQTLTVIPNTVYTVCFEIAVIPRYNTVNSNNQGGEIIEYLPNLQFGVRNGAVQISDPLTYTHANLIQHTTSEFPTRLSFSTSGNGGNQNPGGWTEINPYWENRCITFKAGPSATSVEVFYKTGNPGRSVVLVDGLRLSVEGYANAPTLFPETKTYCAPTQVQLNTFVTSTTPPGAQLKWSPNPDLSNPLPLNPTVTTPGIWYAYYFNPTLGCTSPARKLTLTNTDLDSSFTKVNVTCFGGNNGSIDLSVTGGSGSYTYAWTASNGGSGLNPSAQDQSGLTAGTYNVTVSDGTCTTLETVIITQPNQINVDAGNYGPLCDNVSPITLTGTPTNSNGTWSGPGVTDNGNGTATFNPAGLFGSNTVTYSYTNGSGCSNSDTANIVVHKSPTVDAGNYGPLCNNVSPITLTGTPANSNGTWSGPGVTNNGNGTATFNPAGLNGSITVTYSYTDGNSCTNSDTANILVNTAPTVDAGNYGPLCDNVSPITLTGTPTNSNGTWSGPGVTNNGNGTATFNPAGLSGSITVTYSYTDG